jgi:hypothetical protein
MVDGSRRLRRRILPPGWPATPDFRLKADAIGARALPRSDFRLKPEATGCSGYPNTYAGIFFNRSAAGAYSMVIAAGALYWIVQVLGGPWHRLTSASLASESSLQSAGQRQLHVRRRSAGASSWCYGVRPPKAMTYPSGSST